MIADRSRLGVHAWLNDRFGAQGDAIYLFGAALIALATSGLVAHAFKRPLLFPSLGPTAILFFEAPLSPDASPRNALLGHFVGIVAGVASLALFGLLHSPSALVQGMTYPRIGAASLSLALTGAALAMMRSKHSPAGATTLIVSLGLIASRPGIASIAVGVILLTVVATGINFVLGTRVPFSGHASKTLGVAPGD